MSESENRMVSYRHTQKGPWGLLLYAGAIVLLTVSWPVPNASALPIALGVIGFVVLGTSFHRLTVVDEGRQLVIHFGPLPLFRRRIWYAEIIDAQQGRTTLLDGWGIHWTPWKNCPGNSAFSLRCPSEHLRLEWSDVDWAAGRITVHSPKTEHHVDGESRVIPLFPELRPFLEEVWDQAETGTKNVITRYGSTNANLRTQLCKNIRRAGLVTWPKLFQNLRATRQTELAEEYPAHVVSAWIGNSRVVAEKHYLQVTDDHYTSAL